MAQRSDSIPHFEYTVTGPAQEAGDDGSLTDSSGSLLAANNQPSTRARIRRRVSEAPGTADESATLVGEEERLMSIDYDDVVSREEVEDIAKGVWVPNGEYPALSTLHQHLDYRKAWEIGRLGTQLMQRSSAARKTDAGFFCDAEFDGTDPVRFLRVRRARERDRWSVRKSVYTSIIGEIGDGPIHIFPADSLLSATFVRVLGTFTVLELSKVRPQMAQASVTFDLVKGPFLDAMVFCLWQVKIQMEIRKIRLQRISNMIQLEQASTQRRRDISRARAAINRLSEGGGDQSKVRSVPHPDLLYDPAPQRARLSSSLVIPKVNRPRLSS